MANFDSFFDKIKKDYPGNANNANRGRRFEDFCIWFLKNSEHKSKFKNIWKWMEWPDREKNQFRQDIGIDLVAENHDGELFAIQAKCHTDVVPTDEIDKFLSVSGREEFAYRILISTSDVSKNGYTKIKNQEKPVQTIFKRHFNESVLKLDKFFDLPGEDSEVPELREYIDFQNITIENYKNEIAEENESKNESLNKVRRYYKIMGYAIAALSILAIGLIGILMNKNQDVAALQQDVDTLQQNVAALQQDIDTKASQINSLNDQKKSVEKTLDSLLLPAPVRAQEIKQGTFKPLEDLVLRFDVKAQQDVVFEIFCEIYCKAYIQDPNGNMIRDFRGDRPDNTIKQGTASIKNTAMGGQYSVFLNHPFSGGSQEKWNYKVTRITYTKYQ